ncbi:MAG: contractile injection system tape measure protein [Pseudomonadota bacterium]
MTPAHRIQTVTFDLDIASGLAPDAVFDLVSATCQSAIEQAVGTSFSGSDTGTIERVEVDLGTLPFRRLREDLPRAIRRELPVALHGASVRARDPVEVFDGWLAGREPAAAMMDALPDVAPQKRQVLFATPAALRRAAMLPDAVFAELMTQFGVSAAALKTLERVLALPWQSDMSVPARMEFFRLALRRAVDVPDVFNVASKVTGVARDEIEDRLNDQVAADPGTPTTPAEHGGFKDFCAATEGHACAAPMRDALLYLEPAIEHRWGPRQRRLVSAARRILDASTPPTDVAGWIEALATTVGSWRRPTDPENPPSAESPKALLQAFQMHLPRPHQLYAAVCDTPWDTHEQVLELAAPGRAGLLLTAIRAAEAEGVPPAIGAALWRQIYPVVLDGAASNAADAQLHALLARAAIVLGIGRTDVAGWLRAGARAQHGAGDAARFGPLLQMLPAEATGAPAQPSGNQTEAEAAPPMSQAAMALHYGTAAQVAAALRTGSPPISDTLQDALADGTLDTPEGTRALRDAVRSARGRAMLASVQPDDLRHALLVRVLGADVAQGVQTILGLMAHIDLPIKPSAVALVDQALQAHAQGKADIVLPALRSVSAASGVALPALLALLRSVASGPMARRLKILSHQAWRDAVLVPDPTILADSTRDVAATDTATHTDAHLATAIAGAVLLWPFLPHYVDRLATLTGLQDLPLRAQAVAEIDMLLHDGARSGDEDTALLKLLLGVPLALPTPLPLDETEVTAVGHDMLQAVLAAWPKLDGTSVPGLIESFLRRPGLLDIEDTGRQLRVEKRPYDMLLDHLPWTLSTLRLSWMTAPLTVVWR